MASVKGTVEITIAPKSVRALIGVARDVLNLENSPMGTAYELPRLMAHARAVLAEIETQETPRGPFAVMAGAPWNVLDSRGVRIACCGGDSNADWERFGPPIAAAIVAALNADHATLRRAETAERERDKARAESDATHKALNDCGICNITNYGEFLTLPERVAEVARVIHQLKAVAQEAQAFIREIADDRDDRVSPGVKEKARGLLP